MNLYKKILEKSKNIDWHNKKIDSKLTFNFPVSKKHSRYKKLKKYKLQFKSINKFKFKKTDLILVDKSLLDKIPIDKQKYSFVEYIASSERNTKTLNFAEKILIKYYGKKIKRVICIGGGVILDMGSYLGEQLKTDLILIPTTIIAMADASMGGKVRMNFVDGGRYIKHYHKSFYEPNEIIVDFAFLKTLNQKQIGIGMAEPIKHAFAQSPKFVRYILSDSFKPFTDLESLKTAIVWTIALKQVCLTVDPEESTKGSHKIIYLAHNYSNKVEEDSLFKISHGEAVEKGMLEEFAKNHIKLTQLKAIYSKLKIQY